MQLHNEIVSDIPKKILTEDRNKVLKEKFKLSNFAIGLLNEDMTWLAEKNHYLKD